MSRGYGVSMVGGVARYGRGAITIANEIEPVVASASTENEIDAIVALATVAMRSDPACLCAPAVGFGSDSRNPVDDWAVIKKT
jgi:hypothetical protein